MRFKFILGVFAILQSATASFARECQSNWFDWQPYLDRYDLHPFASAIDQAAYLEWEPNSFAADAGTYIQIYTGQDNGNNGASWVILEEDERTGNVCRAFSGSNWKRTPWINREDIPTSVPAMNLFDRDYCTPNLNYGRFVLILAYMGQYQTHSMLAGDVGLGLFRAASAKNG